MKTLSLNDDLFNKLNDELSDGKVFKLNAIREIIDNDNTITFDDDFFTCPITHCCYDDPVIMSDGHIYSYRAIKSWLNENANSPLTNKPIEHKFKRSHIFNTILELYYDKYPEERPELPSVEVLIDEMYKNPEYICNNMTYVKKLSDSLCKYFTFHEQYKDRKRHTLLCKVIQHSKNLDIIKMVISNSSCSSCSSCNEDLLITAINSGNYRVIPYIIEKGKIDINDKLNNGYTIIGFICDWRHIMTNHDMNTDRINVIKYLIEKGADINAETSEGFTPLYHVCGTSPCNSINTIDYDDNAFDLQYYVNQFELVKFLIDNGVRNNINLNVMLSFIGNDYYGFIQYTETEKLNQYFETIKYIIESDIDNFKNNQQYNTAMTMSRILDLYPEMIKYFIDKGFMLHITETSTPLINVCRNKIYSVNHRLQIIKYLVESGEDVNEPLRLTLADLYLSIQTPLSTICRQKYVSKREQQEQFECVKYLVENGADINYPTGTFTYKDNDGLTFALLNDALLNDDDDDNKMKTPLDLILNEVYNNNNDYNYEGQTKLIAYMLDKGARCYSNLSHLNFMLRWYLLWR